ncbi:alpha/beta fold hydrolase [Terricaulis silvestris]|uniref:Carboxylesterase A n=1 Tax=Terricaulis silvestris TaxID=2686094 RepID=A0A6I6MK06_9CAUL|nr:alpha/beta fold hydrolase [Terricaulis silvestris]QGZ93284.1 Carboxylesterase A precursor [Terricaulis silvestris]
MKLTAAVFAVATAFIGAAHAETDIRLEPTACSGWTTVAETVTADCGYLHVPENRANPNSRNIAIAYMRLRSAAATPATPLIIMMGGPGVRSIPARIPGPHPVLETRDLIYLEQRGTVLTNPALRCPEYNAAGRRAGTGQIDGDALARARIAVTRTCADRAREANIDLTGFTSTQVAADIEDLRRAFDYTQVNLYGLSYSGRVMLQVARDFPTSVRAVILNTPMPAEVNYDEFGSTNMRRSLNMVFDACATDASCAHAYPNLRQQFTDIIASARRRLRTISIEDASDPSGHTNVRVTPWVLTTALLDQLYDRQSIEQLPRRIDAIARGETGALREILDGGASNYPWLQRIAIWCNEEYAFEDQAAIRRQRTDFLEFSGVDQSTVPPGVCDSAGLRAATPRDNERITSEAPVLIFSGAFDAATPPAWQAAMTQTLPNARHVIFPWASHGAGFSRCGWEMTLAFLADPQAPLNAACVAAPDRLNFALPEAP